MAESVLTISLITRVEKVFVFSILYLVLDSALIGCPFLVHLKNSGWLPLLTPHKTWKVEPSLWVFNLNIGVNFGTDWNSYNIISIYHVQMVYVPDKLFALTEWIDRNKNKFNKQFIFSQTLDSEVY